MANKIFKKMLFTILLISLIVNLSSVNGLEIQINKDNTVKSEELIVFDNDIFVDDNRPPGWYDEFHVKTISEGIANASEGDTIYVYNGTYYETIVINKSVYLVGENNQNTIIDGEKIFDVVSITADSVFISNFTIQNSSVDIDFPRSGIRIYSNYTTINNNIITKNQEGIEICNLPAIFYTCHNNDIIDNSFIENSLTIDNSQNNIVNNNYFKAIDSQTLDGIFLKNSKNNLIKDNIITGSYNTAIYLTGSNNNTINNNEIEDCLEEGILISNSNKNKIHHNTINNSDEGVSLTNSDNNLIKFNVIKNNDKGIWLLKSNKNNIRYNSIINNRLGVVIEKSILNKIHHNNIINCKIKSLLLLSFFNNWHRNYWNRPRILPKRIFGIGGLIIGRQDLFPKFFPNEI